ncbi:manganese-dependent ADP-ribose/CDP-alcohol diphosphatase-like [Saccoglossus kowalevskii]|uniref:Manganese-dependent ADP-ribose/CDP-alcohol diphosphatase n=1 Tax=Saccoglossus kowalevskii TaxID=10224 RepID=A0ABM0GML3_SACKO|nr:PREDICTED: manganese-dependent ADP-ribose/CDP-alcohol diphosphatase-like [Saccoglossus kowalevskii]
MASSKAPLHFSFGLIADIQYADHDDRMNYQQTQWRYYRNSLNHLQEAVYTWNSEENRNIEFVIQLGDLIDGRNFEKGGTSESNRALHVVSDAYKSFAGRIHHTWGNHELYNFTREQLFKTSLYSSPHRATSDNKIAYYSFTPFDGYRFVILDTFEISLIGSERGSPEFNKAVKILKNNKNEDKNSSIGISGMDRRFMAFNGGVSEKQLLWLDGVLDEASRNGERIIISGHLPIYEPATESLCLLWNFDSMLDVIHKYKCVMAYISGHDHFGGYAVDEYGVHHVTMEGVIEIPPGSNAFATVDMYQDRMMLRGYGVVASREMIFPK